MMDDVGRIVTSDACVAEGAAWLAATDPDMARILPGLLPLPLRSKPRGFAELLSAIVSQQVSTASAAAIWGRVSDAGMVTAQAVAAASEAELRALGLSRPKVRYAHALAAAGVDFAALEALPDAEVIALLVAVPGIGPWTAEIYAMFSLGRADVFAPGDLALQEAVRDLLGMETRPAARALAAIAVRWSPWRSVAARALFAHYRVVKGREGGR